MRLLRIYPLPFTSWNLHLLADPVKRYYSGEEETLSICFNSSRCFEILGKLMMMESARRGDSIVGRNQRRKVKKVIYLLYTMRFALCSLLSLFLIVFYTPQSEFRNPR